MRRSPLRALALLLALAAAAPAAAGVILDTLAGSGLAEPGWSGAVEGGFEATGGNTELWSLNAGGRVLRRGDRDLWRLQGQIERTETDGMESSRAVVGHLRHNHALGSGLHSIGFVQIQHNPFQRLRSRWLTGAGLRWDLRADDDGRLAVGATHMVEVERIEDVAGSDTDHRLSAFLHVGRRLSPTAKLTGVFFVQPLWRDLSDRRAMGKLALEVALSDALTLTVGGNVEYDARPPAGVDTTDWRTLTGLGVAF